jgi:hypothetical protein
MGVAIVSEDAVSSMFITLAAVAAILALWRGRRRPWVLVLLGMAALAVGAALWGGGSHTWGPSGPGAGAVRQTELSAPGRALQGVGGLDTATSATGSFTTSLPIQAPVFHGLQPRISLDYDSSGGNGEVGCWVAIDGWIGDRQKWSPGRASEV